MMVSLQHMAMPLFLNSNMEKEFSFNFWQQCEAFINANMRRFKIRTSDMGPPTGMASLTPLWQYFLIDLPHPAQDTLTSRL